MEKLTFVIPTLLGVEGLTANELRRMNMEGVRVENGRVFCQGGPQDIARVEPAAEDWGTGAYLTGHLSGTDL